MINGLLLHRPISIPKVKDNQNTTFKHVNVVESIWRIVTMLRVRPFLTKALDLCKMAAGNSESRTATFCTEVDLEKSLTNTVLKLEEIDKNIYRGLNQWKPVNGRGIFGGQIIGQALVAASRTKPEHVHLHSQHCYFVRPGDADYPIIYQVERVRDGRSFATRLVKAIQHGEIILTMQVSFMKKEDSILDYQIVMPQVEPPENLKSTDQIMRDYLEYAEDVSDKRRDYVTKLLAQDVPMEIRPVCPEDYMGVSDEAHEPKLQVWIRAVGHIGEDQNIHHCVAAYLSDFALLRTALVPYPRFRPNMMASLDHTMWFHSDFHADEWMLYECESPRTIGARALCLGRLWKQDGTLAVSVAQEGVVRGEIRSSKL